MHFKDTIEETCRTNPSTHLAMMFLKDEINPKQKLKFEKYPSHHDVCERLDQPKIEAQTQETDARVRTQIELLVDKPIWSIIVINFQDHQTTEIIEESVLLKQGTIVEHYFYTLK